MMVGISEGCNYDDADDDADNDDVNDALNVILGHDTYVMTLILFRDMGELDEVASLAERGALMYRQVSKRSDLCFNQTKHMKHIRMKM